MFGNCTRETVENPTSGLVKLLQQINCDIPKLTWEHIRNTMTNSKPKPQLVQNNFNDLPTRKSLQPSSETVILLFPVSPEKLYSLFRFFKERKGTESCLSSDSRNFHLASDLRVVSRISDLNYGPR